MLRDFSKKNATIFSALDNRDEETNTNGLVNKPLNFEILLF